MITGALTVKPVRVPTLVIAVWAAVVTVPAVVAESAAPAVATFKLATRVVEVTTKGAVPVVVVLSTIVNRPAAAVVPPIAGGLAK